MPIVDTLINTRGLKITNEVASLGSAGALATLLDVEHEVTVTIVTQIKKAKNKFLHILLYSL
jgi:hypothetical protein